MAIIKINDFIKKNKVIQQTNNNIRDKIFSLNNNALQIIDLFTNSRKPEASISNAEKLNKYQNLYKDNDVENLFQHLTECNSRFQNLSESYIKTCENIKNKLKEINDTIESNVSNPFIPKKIQINWRELGDVTDNISNNKDSLNYINQLLKLTLEGGGILKVLNDKTLTQPDSKPNELRAQYLKELESFDQHKNSLNNSMFSIIDVLIKENERFQKNKKTIAYPNTILSTCLEYINILSSNIKPSHENTNNLPKDNQYHSNTSQTLTRKKNHLSEKTQEQLSIIKKDLQKVKLVPEEINKNHPKTPAETPEVPGKKTSNKINSL